MGTNGWTKIRRFKLVWCPHRKNYIHIPIRQGHETVPTFEYASGYHWWERGALIRP